ncbi:MAG TPA: Calx-beta domain-containing protein, partial [Saprospiraceae bacterium]|nr:Calx-beta domain-containing protein [Saprospiraceae bacterium]
MSIPLSFALFSKKRSINTFFSLMLFLSVFGTDLFGQCPLFSNEIHYDNSGADANERIEIGGEAGTSMTGWSVVFYNGFDGTVVATVNLTGNFPAAVCTVSGVPISFRVINVVAETGISFANGEGTGAENMGGPGDGWALVNGSTVVEFYSYEGVFTATNGPANGMMSTNIGVFENGAGASSGSIQRTSTSTWTVDASNNTFGACNTSQYGPPCGSNPIVNLSLSAIEGSEANTTVVTATANATAPVSGAQTVTLAITGTNITGGDYNLTNTTITIPNGASFGSVTFTVVNDAVAETAELAVFTISNPSAGITLGATVSRNLIIYDNDAPLATRCLVSSNEIHYDNAGADANERIEIAGDATTSLTGWSIILYQQDGTVYGSANLTGTIPNTGTCTVSGRTIGLVSLDIPALTGQGLQGGPSDGWALAYNSTIVEFFSYEGTILATEGPALGMTSVDIGASEDGTGTSAGSIQRTGPNTWVTSTSTNTFGACNSPQYVTPCSTIPTVDLTLNVYEGTENAGTVVQVIATTNSAVTGNQTVNLTITGTNVTGSDYTISNLVITIPNGTNTGTVTFTVLNDALFENVETVNFSI